MHKPCIIKSFYDLCLFKHIFAISAFIAQRPEHHTRAVYITLYKTFPTIFYGIAKPLVASKHCNAVVIGIVPLVIIIDLHTAM